MKLDHPFHRAVGDVLRAEPPSDCRLVLDHACGGCHQVPLVAGSIKSRATRTCYVDALIVGSNQTVPWIIEIEESDIDPTHIFGKIGTSAAASHFIHRILDDVPVAIE